jgi:hypothetical protein
MTDKRHDRRALARDTDHDNCRLWTGDQETPKIGQVPLRATSLRVDTEYPEEPARNVCDGDEDLLAVVSSVNSGPQP